MSSEGIEEIIRMLRELIDKDDLSKFVMSMETHEARQRRSVDSIKSRFDSLASIATRLAAVVDSVMETDSKKKISDAATSLGDGADDEMLEIVRISFVAGYVCRLKQEADNVGGD